MKVILLINMCLIYFIIVKLQIKTQSYKIQTIIQTSVVRSPLTKVSRATREGLMEVIEMIKNETQIVTRMRIMVNVSDSISIRHMRL